MPLTAGAAREIITPEVGGLLFGYNDHTASQSIHDDLTVTALAVESGGAAFLLLSATVCLVNNDLANKIRAKAGAAAGIPAGHVILSATHTHSGPCTEGFSGWGSIDQGYCEKIFVPKCVAAAQGAMAARQPVKVGVGITESKVGINRRQLGRDNRVSLGQNPWDMYDSTMTVVALRGTDRKPLANIIHVGAHCTAAGINYEITRDWAGVMADRLEEESGAMTLFVNGTLGDVAPRMANGGSTGDIKHAMEVGGLAGIDAVRAYKTIRTYYEEPLALNVGDIEIPFEPTDALKYRQTVVCLGPVALVPFPFEVCSEIGLRLRHYSPFAHTLLLSCTNGSNSYLPAQSQLCRGGYEVDSFRRFHPGQLPDDTDRLLIERNLELLESML
ncbi:MAG: hypothetical protein FWD25_10315 [Clostridia bacterium]|nr:hypothetical protein [Clostridia bacterium]